MTLGVYALYFPSAVRPVSGVQMEYFVNRDLAAKLLIQRNQEGVSPAHWVHLAGNRYAERPVQDFPNADDTGYMRAFLRRLSDPEPELLARPDEEWLVEQNSRGRDMVVRIPWCDSVDDAEVAVAMGGQSLVCVPYRPAPTERSEWTR